MIAQQGITHWVSPPCSCSSSPFPILSPWTCRGLSLAWTSESPRVGRIRKGLSGERSLASAQIRAVPPPRSEPCPQLRGWGSWAGRQSVRPDMGIHTWPLLKGGCCPRGPCRVFGLLSLGTCEPSLAHGGNANLISLALSPS